MPSLLRAYAATVMIALTSLSTGCAQAMPDHTPRGQVLANEWPLRFKEHNFAAHCYNTASCRVVYNEYDFTSQIEPQPSGPPPPGDYQSKWKASYVGVPNFPAPVDVRWTTPDGASHEASVDLAAIFKDQVVLHRVPREDIPEGWAHEVRPDILLEVNGNTVNVYMRAHIATKLPQVPGNSYSNFRNDVILAWSHTY